MSLKPAICREQLNRIQPVSVILTAELYLQVELPHLKNLQAWEAGKWKWWAPGTWTSLTGTMPDPSVRCKLLARDKTLDMRLPWACGFTICIRLLVRDALHLLNYLITTR